MPKGVEHGIPLAVRWRLFKQALSGLIAPGAAQGMLAGVLQRGEPPRRGTQELLRAYRQMPWLRAVTHKVSFNTASVQWQLFVIRPEAGKKAIRHIKAQRGTLRDRARARKQASAQGMDVQEITDHPLLDVLHHANDVMIGLTARQVTQIWLDLKGEAYWLKERNIASAPQAIWPVPPHWVKRTPTPDYPFFELGFRGWQGIVPATEVVWFQSPDPENPYGRGTGVAEALGDELETDEYTAKYTKSWFYNSARPDLLVAGDQLSPAEARRLEENWNAKHQGFWQAFKAHFTNAKLDVHQISQTFESMQLVDLRRFERDTIVQVYGVPPEILGILTNSNRATIEAATYLYAEHVLVPRLELMRNYMQERLVPDFDERLILDYESPVPEDKEHRLNVAKAAPFSVLVDEWRAMRGDEPLPDEQGQVVFVPFNLKTMRPEELRPASGESQTPEEPPAQRSKSRRKDALLEGDIDRLLQEVDAELLRDGLDPVLRSLITEWGERAFRELELEPSFDMQNSRVTRFIADFSGERIRGINETTLEQLRESLVEGVQAGEGIPALAKRVSTVFSDAKGTRATTIARTEVIRASGWTSNEAWTQMGKDVVPGREWLATRDTRTRDEHLAMDGQVQPMGRKFEAPGGSTADYPGGFGIAELDINCRCAVAPVIDLGEEEESRSIRTTEERDALWRVFDLEIRPWERQFESAAKKAFQAQQNVVMAALRRLGEEAA